jgi:hypothetical protein
LQFFSGWQGLDYLRRIRPDCQHEDYRNVDGLIGKLIASGRATLQELRSIYTLEDALTMWEAVVVPEYNEYMAVEAMKRRRG